MYFVQTLMFTIISYHKGIRYRIIIKYETFVYVSTMYSANTYFGKKILNLLLNNKNILIHSVNKIYVQSNATLCM